jgi:2,3-bisphosphoglycerate-independent phosphoglycerate mutase
MKKIILIILDGWGIEKDKKKSAIKSANLKFINSLFEKFPSTHLNASEEFVGLPKGQMGNSEVGHSSIGAGRIIYQDLVKINKEIDSKNFFENKILSEAANYIKEKNKKLHIIGLLSDGGVHSHKDHFEALVDFFHQKNIKIFLHAITDGRDSQIDIAAKDISEIKNKIEKKNGKISTVIGRFFAMDRDNKIERTQNAFDAFVKKKGELSDCFFDSIKNFYSKKIYDEFIPAIISKDHPGIEKEDVVIFFNFRSDRMKQLVSQFLKIQDLKIYTFTDFGLENSKIKIIFEKEKIENTLSEIISKNKMKQLKIAETEKYPHVTYFFSYGKQRPFEGEKQIMCNSPKNKTYEEIPEMACFEITKKAMDELKNNYNFICINYANADMVGHSGNFQATVKACEFIDECLSKLIPLARRENYSIILTSDHGNADFMIDERGKICTTHSLNKVPFLFIDENIKSLNSKKENSLCDIAPTILKFLNLEKSIEMTGKSLI